MHNALLQYAYKFMEAFAKKIQIHMILNMYGS